MLNTFIWMTFGDFNPSFNAKIIMTDVQFWLTIIIIIANFMIQIAR